MFFMKPALLDQSEKAQRITAMIVALLGRILLGQVFFLAGINKLLDPARTIKLIASHGIPFPTFCCFAAAALEIVGSLAFVFGIKIRWIALSLAVFVIVVTSIFHWDLSKDINIHLFRKDLAIAGGLLLVAKLYSRQNTSGGADQAIFAGSKLFHSGMAIQTATADQAEPLDETIDGRAE
jgi:putative oxidoreductase